jgi:hypothetical protein
MKPRRPGPSLSPTNRTSTTACPAGVISFAGGSNLSVQGVGEGVIQGVDRGLLPDETTCEVMSEVIDEVTCTKFADVKVGVKVSVKTDLHDRKSRPATTTRSTT